MASVYSFFEKIAKKSRIIYFGLALVALLLVFRGCRIDQILNEHYYIGQDSRWSSIQLMGKEKNLTAFNNHLLSAIGQEEGIQMIIETSPSPDLIKELEAGKLQGVLTSLQSSYLNEEKLLFSPSYFLTGPVLTIPSGEPLEGWNELGKKIIAIPPNSPLLPTLEQDATIQIKIYSGILQALSDLAERKIDGVIFPAIPSHTYVNTFYSTELKIATLPLTDEGVRFVVLNNKKGGKLLKIFNEGLKKLKEKGIFHQLLDHWGFLNVENLSNSATDSQ